MPSELCSSNTMVTVSEHDTCVLPAANDLLTNANTAASTTTVDVFDLVFRGIRKNNTLSVSSSHSLHTRVLQRRFWESIRGEATKDGPDALLTYLKPRMQELAPRQRSSSPVPESKKPLFQRRNVGPSSLNVVESRVDAIVVHKQAGQSQDMILTAASPFPCPSLSNRNTFAAPVFRHPVLMPVVPCASAPVLAPPVNRQLTFTTMPSTPEPVTISSTAQYQFPMLLPVQPIGHPSRSSTSTSSCRRESVAVHRRVSTRADLNEMSSQDYHNNNSNSNSVVAQSEGYAQSSPFRVSAGGVMCPPDASPSSKRKRMQAVSLPMVRHASLPLVVT